MDNVDEEQLNWDISLLFKRRTDALNAEHPWFDKSGNPEMIEAIPTLRLLWPDSIFIFAKRRALENISSRLKKFPGHSFEFHCVDWAKNMTAWRATRQSLPKDRFIEIDQQDMIQKPLEVARELSALLSLSTEDQTAIVSTLRRNRPQETEAGSAAKIHALADLPWSPLQREVFERHCMGEMTSYGYSTDSSYWLLPQV